MTKNCYKLLRKIASFSLNNPYSYNATETFKYTNEPKSYTKPTYTQPKYNAAAQNTFDPGRYMPSTSSTINFGAVGGNSEENKNYSKYQKQFGQWLGQKLGLTKPEQKPEQSSNSTPEQNTEATQPDSVYNKGYKFVKNTVIPATKNAIKSGVDFVKGQQQQVDNAYKQGVNLVTNVAIPTAKNIYGKVHNWAKTKVSQ